MSVPWLSVLCLGTALVLTGCPDEDASNQDGDAADGAKKTSSKKKGKAKGKGDGKSKSKKGKDDEAKDDEAKGDGEAAPTSQPSDGSVPAPLPGEVPKFTVGAWSKYKLTTGTAIWSVLDKRGDEILIDALMEGRMNLAVQSWVSVPDAGDTRTSSIRELKYRLGGGAVQTLQGSALKGHAQLYDRIIKGFLPPKFEGMPQEDVTVAAGTFRGCYKWTSKETIMNITTESTIWTHPAVPPPSMVKLVSHTDDATYELIAYGASGAKPSL